MSGVQTTSIDQETDQLWKTAAICLAIFSAPFLYRFGWLLFGTATGAGLRVLPLRWLTYYALYGAILIQGVRMLVVLKEKKTDLFLLPLKQYGRAQIIAVAVVTISVWYMESTFVIDPSNPIEFYILFPFVLHFAFTALFGPRIMAIDPKARRIIRFRFFWLTALFGGSVDLGRFSTVRTYGVRTRKGTHHYLAFEGGSKLNMSIVPNPLLSMQLDRIGSITGLTVGERADR